MENLESVAVAGDEGKNRGLSNHLERPLKQSSGSASFNPSTWAAEADPSL